MSKAPSIKWDGKNGTYTYRIYPIGTPMKDTAGNYIYAYKYQGADRSWYWKPVYIGEGNLKDRSNLGGHDRGNCIKNNGATHFHAHTNSVKSTRLDEETDLRANYSTPCNRQ